MNGEWRMENGEWRMEKYWCWQLRVESGELRVGIFGTLHFQLSTLHNAKR